MPTSSTDAGQVAILLRHGQSALAGTLLEDVLDESFTRLVRAANQRTTGAVQETHIECTLSPELEDLWCNVLLDLHVALCRTHVLAKGHDIDVDCTKFCFLSVMFNEY